MSANYIYLHKESDAFQAQKSALEDYCKSNNIKVDNFVVDDEIIKQYWTGRKIGDIMRNMEKGGCLVVFDALSLACSTSQILEILTLAAENQVDVHFAKYATIIKNDKPYVDTRILLKLIGSIESNFISKRTVQALARRRASGLPLGRPKGKGNKSLKLDKHKEEIYKYIELGISKASIAKLVGCHPQTLYDWIERNKRRTA